MLDPLTGVEVAHPAGDHARGVDRQEGAVVEAHPLLAVDGRGSGPQPRRLDEVTRPFRVHDEPGSRQLAHDLPRPPGVIEVDVGDDHVVHAIAREAERLEGGEQPGHREGGPDIHEGRAPVLHDEMRGVEEGAHEARVDRVDTVAEGLDGHGVASGVLGGSVILFR